MSDIQNIETIVHLHYLRTRHPKDAAELIEHTQSVKYAETTAIQTGYERSAPPLLFGGAEEAIGDLMKFQEKGNPVRVEENDAILAKYGFTRDTFMLMKFDIDFLVRPTR